jgi:hypothetical protein
LAVWVWRCWLHLAQLLVQLPMRLLAQMVVQLLAGCW